jgi:NADPH2:quinone reductase
MKAAVLSDSGVRIGEAPKPQPARNQVLVRVRASSLNRADLLVAGGHMHGAIGGPGTVIGLEFAGEVEAIGGDVRDVREGDRVMCSGSGGFAEYAVTDWGRVAPIPTNTMSFEEAATLPVALQTMHDALVTNGRFKAGEAVLIQGASSGVGLMGLQIARLRGARLVIGTSSDAARRGRLKQFGADLAIDAHISCWSEAVLDATDRRGVDLIVDQVSAGVSRENMRAAAVGGRIVNVGRLGGFTGEFDFDLHAMKRIDYIGVTFRTRSVDEVREVTRRMRADLWGDVASGRLRLPIDRVFPLDQAASALQRMRANAHFGKIVLSV